ncbi:hypothetical protein [Corynebacterium sp. AOP40-4SA-5]|uniref:hypothetical protein n=1 Tax=Corynebacterium sp. AOP40-4SA-5 TaxID=3457678 RepID=UPI0040338C31
MTEPLTPNEQNARTRAATYGIRPDLYEGLQSFMVKKDDLPLLAGVSGYVAASTLSHPGHGAAGYGLAGLKQSALVRNAEYFELQPGSGNPWPMPVGGIRFNKTGLWKIDVRISSSATATTNFFLDRIVYRRGVDPVSENGRDAGEFESGGASGVILSDSCFLEVNTAGDELFYRSRVMDVEIGGSSAEISAMCLTG